MKQDKYLLMKLHQKSVRLSSSVVHQTKTNAKQNIFFTLIFLFSFVNYTTRLDNIVERYVDG